MWSWGDPVGAGEGAVLWQEPELCAAPGASPQEKELFPWLNTMTADEVEFHIHMRMEIPEKIEGSDVE